MRILLSLLAVCGACIFGYSWANGRKEPAKSEGSQQAARQLPALTEEGIQRLIKRLDQDLVEVLASEAPQALKDDIREQIVALKLVLEASKADISHMCDWIKEIQPRFAQLTARLRQAISPISGACYYEGGCIVCTQAQCMVLGGIFMPDEDCDYCGPR